MTIAGPWSVRVSYDDVDMVMSDAPATLGTEVTGDLASALALALPDLRVPEFMAAQPRYFDDCGMLIAAYAADGGGLAGVLVSRVLAGFGVDRTLHVSMQLIAPRFRRTLLLKRMWALHLASVAADGGIPELMAMRSCNPTVLQLLRGFARVDGIAAYPEIDGGEQDPELQRIATEIAERVCPGREFDPRTGVLRGAAIPPDFYSDLPSGRDPAVNAYFRRHLTAADRVLCLVRITTETAKQRLLRAFGADRLPIGAPA